MLYRFLLSSTQGGEITAYGLAEWQISSVGLHVQKKDWHDNQLKHPLEDKNKNNMSKGIEPKSSMDRHAI